MYELEGKTALITGGNSGMGRSTALAFAKCGANVVVAARRPDYGNSVAGEINQYNGNAIFVQTDVQIESSVHELMDTIYSKFGRLDFAFNNAGIIDDYVALPEMSFDQWRSVIDTNLSGVFLCMKYELEIMINQRTGCIVNNSSTSGLRGDSDHTSAAYTASKHGVIGLTRTASIQNAKYGIRINAICPGWINTPMIEGSDPVDLENAKNIKGTLGRIGEPDEIANAVLWLCSDKAGFITGQTLVIDGGDSSS